MFNEECLVDKTPFQETLQAFGQDLARTHNEVKARGRQVASLIQEAKAELERINGELLASRREEELADRSTPLIEGNRTPTTPTEIGAPTTPTEIGAPTTPTEIGAPTTPTEIGAPTTPAEIGAPTTPAEIGAPTTPAEIGAPTTPAEIGAPTTPTEIGAPTTPTEIGAPTTPTEIGAPTTPAEIGAPTTPAEIGAPTTPTEIGAPTTPTEIGAPTTPTEIGAPTTPTEIGAPTTPTEIGAPTTPAEIGAPTTPAEIGAPIALGGELLAYTRRREEELAIYRSTLAIATTKAAASRAKYVACESEVTSSAITPAILRCFEDDAVRKKRILASRQNDLGIMRIKLSPPYTGLYESPFAERLVELLDIPPAEAFEVRRLLTTAKARKDECDRALAEATRKKSFWSSKSAPPESSLSKDTEFCMAITGLMGKIAAVQLATDKELKVDIKDVMEIYSADKATSKDDLYALRMKYSTAQKVLIKKAHLPALQLDSLADALEESEAALTLKLTEWDLNLQEISLTKTSLESAFADIDSLDVEAALRLFETHATFIQKLHAWLTLDANKALHASLPEKMGHLLQRKREFLSCFSSISSKTTAMEAQKETLILKADGLEARKKSADDAHHALLTLAERLAQKKLQALARAFADALAESEDDLTSKLEAWDLKVQEISSTKTSLESAFTNIDNLDVEAALTLFETHAASIQQLQAWLALDANKELYASLPEIEPLLQRKRAFLSHFSSPQAPIIEAREEALIAKTDSLEARRKSTDDAYLALRALADRLAQKKLQALAKAFADALAESEDDLTSKLEAWDLKVQEISSTKISLESAFTNIDNLDVEAALTLFETHAASIQQLQAWLALDANKELYASLPEIEPLLQRKRAFLSHFSSPQAPIIEAREEALIAKTDSLETRKKSTDDAYLALRALADRLSKKEKELKIKRLQALAPALTIQKPVDKTSAEALLATITPHLEKLTESAAFIQSLRSSSDPEISPHVARVAEQQESLLTTRKNALIVQKASQLKLKFFGAEKELSSQELAGEFGNYLTERATTFWLRDLFSQYIALLFGQFGYMPTATLRRQKLHELQFSLDAYRKDPNDNTYQVLIEQLKDNINLFSPRTRQGQAGYEKSLHYRLSTFKAEIEKIHVSPDDGPQNTVN